MLQQHGQTEPTITVNLPARSYPPGNASHAFPAHNLGKLLFGVLLISDTQLPTGEPYQGTSAATRHFSLAVDTNNAALREVWNFSSVSAVTQSFRAILIDDAPDGVVLHKSYRGPDRVAFGGGKFDTEKSYLKASATPTFWMSRGRTIDTTGNGYRGIRPNGAQLQLGSYTGSFTGSGFFGVEP